MRLNFPNPSRSFDETGSRIRFWGYDRAIEISFYVEAEALKRLCPEMGRDEAGLLEAFDQSRERIQEVAEQVYVRGSHSKGTYAYVLSARDF